MEPAWSRQHGGDSLRFDRRRYRTVWIADVHPGFRGCSAEYLLDGESALATCGPPPRRHARTDRGNAAS